MDYDAIIIGAGLGGCAAGCVLAGAGKKVLLLERMDRVGGRCSSQEREGFVMDLGSHIMLRSEYGPLREALKRVGRHRVVKFHHLDKVMIKHQDLEVKLNVGAVMEDASSLLPSGIIKMGGKMIPGMLGMVGDVAGAFDEISVSDLLSNYVDCALVDDLVNLVQTAGFGTPYWVTASGEVLRVLMGAVSAALDGFSDGVICTGFPEGGLRAIPEAMCEGIEDLGGEIRTGANVKKVIVKDERAAGVELDDGETIEAKVVLSNAGIKETVAGLVGEELFESDYAESVGGLLPGMSAFCVRAALDEPISDVDFGVCVPVEGLADYYHAVWDDLSIPDALPPIVFSFPSNMDPSLAPDGKQSMIASGSMMYGSEDRYSKMEPLALESMEKAVPGFRDHLIWHDFLDPGTYMEFGEQMAPAVGIAQSAGQVGENRPSSDSPLEGLYYIGCEAGKNISGMASEMGTESGIVCADRLLKSGKV